MSKNPYTKVTDFPLHVQACRTIADAMKFPATLVVMGALAMISCRKHPEVVEVTEKRPLTTKDGNPKLFATSDERFRDAKPSPVKGETPEGWLAVPATQMRLLNYRFGESGLGEVWVSISSGSVLDNANRWLGQFQAEQMGMDGLAKLKTVPMVGVNGVWVETEGTYNAGMAAGGAAPRSDYALAGVIADVQGRIITVKMVGPKAEVNVAKPALEQFARGLTLNP